MDHSERDSSVITEDMWRAWSHKGKQRGQAVVRKATAFAGAFLIFLLVAGWLYFHAVK
jgi:hypothetical protein